MTPCQTLQTDQIIKATELLYILDIMQRTADKDRSVQMIRQTSFLNSNDAQSLCKKGNTLDQYMQ